MSRPGNIVISNRAFPEHWLRARSGICPHLPAHPESEMARGEGFESQAWFAPLLALGLVGMAWVVGPRFGFSFESANFLRLLVGLGSIGLIGGLIAQATAHHAACLAVEHRKSAGLILRHGALRAACVRAVFVAIPALLCYGCYRVLPFYARPEFVEFRGVVDFLAACFVLLPIPYYFALFSLRPELRLRVGDKSAVLAARVRAAWRRGDVRRLLGNRGRRISRRFHAATASVVVKGFFVPVMISSLLGMRNQLLLQLALFNDAPDGAAIVFTWLLPMMSKVILLADLLVPSAAYLLEFGWLRNRIKSVDPFVTGWIVCLACYFPFDGWLSAALPAAAAGTATWAQSPLLARGLQIAVITAQLLWLTPTLCLGLRASNLTNRGIVGFGPYRVVRHPQYALRMLWLLAESAPRLHIWQVGAHVVFTSLLYVLRGVTEERHLCADPDYRAYAARVRYRLLPGVW